MSERRRRVSVVSRSAADRQRPDAHQRLPAVLDALGELGFDVDPVVFDDLDAPIALAALAGSDAALVWVDPLDDGRDRRVLDEVLREVADRGTLVSTHPDTIARMGTKDVLYDTRALSWSLDPDRYETFDDFAQRFPARLATGQPRVVKQLRGNGGMGVWKVAAIPGRPGELRIQHAAPRDGTTEDVTTATFLSRMAPYFEGGGHLVDQAFATRVAEGMLRAYLVEGEVVGFARQYADRGDPAHPPVPAARVFGIPAAKTMREADDVEFAALRERLEAEWVPGLAHLVGVSVRELPLLWDADFLLGPTDDAGRDAYVLCEINVSCVSPFPASAPHRLATALARRLDREA